jgi:hypothetical protein
VRSSVKSPKGLRRHHQVGRRSSPLLIGAIGLGRVVVTRPRRTSLQYNLPQKGTGVSRPLTAGNSPRNSCGNQCPPRRIGARNSAPGGTEQPNKPFNWPDTPVEMSLISPSALEGCIGLRLKTPFYRSSFTRSGLVLGFRDQKLPYDFVHFVHFVD